MPSLGYHIAMYAMAWLFWFGLFYFFIYLLKKKKRISQNKRESMFLACKVALAWTLLNVVISVLLENR